MPSEKETDAMQCYTTLDATSTITNGGLPQATYTSQCGVLQDTGVSRDAHAQVITKRNGPTFRGHNSSVREEDGQKKLRQCNGRTRRNTGERRMGAPPEL